MSEIDYYIDKIETLKAIIKDREDKIEVERNINISNKQMFRPLEELYYGGSYRQPDAKERTVISWAVRELNKWFEYKLRRKVG
jgi:hypothetical protein